MAKLVSLIVDNCSIMERQFMGYQVYDIQHINCDPALAKWYTSYSIYGGKKLNIVDGTIECPVCDGTGLAYDPKDRDFYEGYKLADKKTCYKCNGSKIVSLEYYRKAYEDFLIKQEKHAELEKKLQQLKNIIQMPI